jgi:signal transduction histidine kinase/CheY-like chemotaxis protein
MNYDELINGRFSEPAAIHSYRDGKLKTLAINDRFIPELWMNIPREQFIESDINDSFDGNNLKLFLNAVEKCISTGEEQSVETWRQAFSQCCGFDKICLSSRLIFLEKSGDESIIYEGVRNISNERRTQDTLSDIENRYKKTLEQVNIYNWEYDIATKDMRPCYRCMRDLGLPAVVKNYPEPAIEAGIFPPDYADMYREMMRKIDAGAPELEADIPLTVGRVPFRVKYITEFDKDGKPIKAFGSATLISEKELGNIKLDTQIILSLSEEYRCIYLADFITNEVKIIKQIDTFTLGEKSGCSDLLALIESKLPDTDPEQNRLYGNVRTFRAELFKECDRREFVYKDTLGDKWVRISMHVIERNQKQIDRLLVTFSVLDDMRARQMESDKLIASQKKELEEKQEMLLEAIEEANRANTAKTMFFSNMSHDIRTPMSAITGFSRLAMEELDNREHLEDYLEKIVSAGDHLLNLINDILDMSRIESGKMEIAANNIKLRDTLLECADMVRVKMDENKLNFHVDIDEAGDDCVECDKLRFSQIILNLLSNAYKFTPAGGDVYLIGKLLDRAKALTYEIRVKDTGIGMSEEFCKHIWEAYSREKSEIVQETQGTGLGMLIVRNIINLMHGTIDLKSEKGKGSEFIITLPLTPASCGTDPGKTGAASEALNKSYEGVTILVVDDTATNLRLAERILGKYGFTILTSDNGVNAVEMIRNSEPGKIDLVLMDVMMPVMDGLEATRKIRALEDKRLASIPIIAMTANAFASDVQDTLDAGMNAHISKPFRKEDLITAINENLM